MMVILDTLLDTANFQGGSSKSRQCETIVVGFCFLLGSLSLEMKTYMSAIFSKRLILPTLDDVCQSYCATEFAMGILFISLFY